MKRQPDDKRFDQRTIDRARDVVRRVVGSLCPYAYNRVSDYRHRWKPRRCLEIGPGSHRIEGFETLSIALGWRIDYVSDASKPLPFKEATFDLIYASHVLEHIPWYKVEESLREWGRILKLGGQLEIWVPDGLKICKALVEAEEGGRDLTSLDGWYKLNPDRDPCVWASGRLFTYGDGTGRLDHPNWHRAVFTRRYIRRLLEKVGFVGIQDLKPDDVRGHDHGWISLGVRGLKG